MIIRILLILSLVIPGLAYAGIDYEMLAKTKVWTPYEKADPSMMRLGKGSSSTPDVDNILLETGDDLLLETGDKVNME